MRESQFIIQKWIQIRSLDARIRLKNVRGAHERFAWPKAMHWPPRVEAVGDMNLTKSSETRNQYMVTKDRFLIQVYNKDQYKDRDPLSIWR